MAAEALRPRPATAPGSGPSTGLPPAPFQDLFAARVRREPDAVAVSSGDRWLTYRELARRAERLAGRLRREGVGTDAVVPIFAERGPGFLTAMLAVFEAGGAYLPLDPHHPASRLAAVLARSGAPLVVCGGGLEPSLERVTRRLPRSRRPAVVTLDGDAGDGAAPRRRSAAPALDGLAYVIFTSGSTGAPKGAMIHQRGMVNHLEAKVVDLRLGPDDVVAQTASPSFDISVWQFLAPLAVGGRVRVVATEALRDPDRLLADVAAEAVTVLEIVPSLLRVLLDHPRLPRAAGGLRWMIATGEALPPELARRWLALCPGVPLLNAYGPTECSDDVTHHRVTEVPAEASQVPIGRPILNTRIHLVDGGLRERPAGTPGELCVGGTGVGRGYLDDPARTAAAFVPDPFSPAPGARLYCTGDLARLGAGGVIEFLGRVDHQVQIRGFRVEPGEIEAALEAHPEVRAAAVVGRRFGPGDERLLAFVVPAQGEPPAPAALRRHLAARLPAYMVPAAFVPLDALPLTANGKVDRRALAGLTTAPRPAAAVGSAAPGAAAQAVVDAWRRVLEVECIGLDDNFFDLGGDSLLLFRVHRELCRGFADLSVLDLYQFPTVRSLAERLEGAAPARAAWQRGLARGAARRQAGSRRRGTRSRLRGRRPPPGSDEPTRRSP